MSQMTPREIVHELDRHIVGQAAAKRAVALALRTRWRRMQLPEAQRNEVSPKNILMIGPTGVGKTEIARRLARLANAPFIKVEATKFTEVGYVIVPLKRLKSVFSMHCCHPPALAMQHRQTVTLAKFSAKNCVKVIWMIAK